MTINSLNESHGLSVQQNGLINTLSWIMLPTQPQAALIKERPRVKGRSLFHQVFHTAEIDQNLLSLQAS